MKYSSFSNYIIVLVIFLSGCVSGANFKGSKFCSPYLSVGDTVLVSPLPSENWELHLNSIRKEFSRRNVVVLYSPEEEWNFSSAGITNPFDSANYPLLLLKGVTHLLLIQELSSSKGNFYAYKTPYEVGLEANPYLQYKNAPQNDGYKVELDIQLFSLKIKQLYSFTVVGRVNGIQVRDKQGGTTNVNAGNVATARSSAIKKSAKAIIKNCK